MRTSLLVALFLAAGCGLPAGRTGWAAESAVRIGFDGPEDLARLKISGRVALDHSHPHSGKGCLQVRPGGRAVLQFRDRDGTGRVDVWVFDDGKAPAHPKKHAAGPMWGLVQTDGFALAAGPIYAPYLSGATTYAVGSFNPRRNERPWQNVQYLGVRRKAGWRRWTFDFDPVKGLRILVDGRDVNARRTMFNWDKSRLDGFCSVAFRGDASGAGQVLLVDDLRVIPGPPAQRQTQWPPPPPPPPAGWKGPPPPMAPWQTTPYAKWEHGPGRTDEYFPIAVWLQDPALAERYKAAGFNLYVGLWKGPTEKQLERLRRAGMPVICAQNAVGLQHRNDDVIVGWMHGDEPDNAHRFTSFWKRDKERIREAWPEIYKRLRLDTRPYRGYGPPIPPKWIVREYRRMRAADPTRPIMVNLGQGVAWEQYHGRGERTGHLEDYPKYIEGADIVSFDIYPAAHPDIRVRNALWYVARGVDRLRTWCRDRKIVWNALECTTIGVPGAKPTPKQVEAEAWMSIIHGSRGLIWFVHQFKPKFNEHALLDDPDMLAAVSGINHRIHRLARVLNSPTLPGAVSVASSNPKTPVHAMAKRWNGALYVFAVAMYREPTQAAIRIAESAGAGLGPAAEVLDEDRTVPVAADRTLHDAFQGDAVHIYRISCRQ